MIPIIWKIMVLNLVYLSVKFACRIDKYRVDERITIMIGVVLTYLVRSNVEDFLYVAFIIVTSRKNLQ